jgi:hypothetical protein
LREDEARHKTDSGGSFLLQVYWLNLNAGYDGDIFLTVRLSAGLSRDRDRDGSLS